MVARIAGNAFLGVGTRSAINAGNLSQVTIEDNLILSGPTTGGTAIWLIGLTALGQVGVHDLVVQDNYVLGLSGLTAFGPSIGNVTVRNNQFRAEHSDVLALVSGESGATIASDLDPAAAPGIESYQASSGGEPTLFAFLDKARRQWQRHWDAEYTAAAVIQYLRAELGR